MWQFIIPAAASLIAGKMQSDAAKKAAKATAGTADQATALQREMYEKQLELQKPYYEAGTNALRQMTSLDGNQLMQQDPGYQFRLKEGLKALERSAAARGGLLSGNMLKGGMRYAQDYASNEYGNAYNRLAGMAGMGMRTAGDLGGAGQQFGVNAGNIGMQQGANQGNAMLSRGSSYANTLGDMSSLFGRYGRGGNNNFMNSLQSQFAQTWPGGSGFGSGVAYGNQDMGQFLGG